MALISSQVSSRITVPQPEAAGIALLHANSQSADQWLPKARDIGLELARRFGCNLYHAGIGQEA